MHVIRDGLYFYIGWLVITAARYKYRLYCQSLKCIHFLVLIYSYKIKTDALVIYLEARGNDHCEKRIIIIRITSNYHHYTSVQMLFVHSSIEQLLTHVFVFETHARPPPLLFIYVLPLGCVILLFNHYFLLLTSRHWHKVVHLIINN
jgi:hypothetical protein